jgi:8-oxo-dGTP pyrophosphatase MutT (NUDIX family)
MIYTSIPEKFNPRFEVASCFLEYQKKILLLLRQDNKPQASTFGIPAGKIDPGESPVEALAREIFQETKINLPQEKLHYFRKLYVRYPNYDFVYHMFHSTLEKPKKVIINPKEHKGSLWASPKNALFLPLIQDEDLCIRMFYRI